MKHLVFYERLVAAYREVEKLSCCKENKPFYQLKKLLKRIMEDRDLQKVASNLKKNELIFEELRKALRISMPEGRDGLNDEGDGDIRSISLKVSEFINKYESSEETEHIKMIKQIRKYHEKLFADPIETKVNGNVVLIQPQRTNNVMERLFRELKRLLRSRSGSMSLKRPIHRHASQYSSGEEP